ncbi:hypothetical protein Trydic_g6230 [Trypoxylus dichotomus]
MVPFRYCPTCAIDNKTSKLVLRQINFSLAVYLCEDSSCKYPEGYDTVQVEQRSLDELSKEIKQHNTEKSDLDSWLEDFFADDDQKQCAQNKNYTAVDDDELSKIIDEINKPCNDTVAAQTDNDLFAWVDDAFEQFCVNAGGKDADKKENRSNATTNLGSHTNNVKHLEINELASKNNKNETKKLSKTLEPQYVLCPKQKQVLRTSASTSQDSTKTQNKFLNFKYVNTLVKPANK